MAPKSLPDGVRREELPGGGYVTYIDVADLTTAEVYRLFDEVRAAYGLPARGRPDYLPFVAALGLVGFGGFLCLFTFLCLSN
jgi:hypothetical protein